MHSGGGVRRSQSSRREHIKKKDSRQQLALLGRAKHSSVKRVTAARWWPGRIGSHNPPGTTAVTSSVSLVTGK